MIQIICSLVLVVAVLIITVLIDLDRKIRR